jgi:hypothetical protein
MCEYHKQEIAGTKRNDFAKTFYEVLLWTPMQFGMRLYKEVKVGCDCPSNYEVFDTIVKAAIIQMGASILNPTQEGSHSPKDTEQNTH